MVVKHSSNKGSCNSKVPSSLRRQIVYSSVKTVSLNDLRGRMSKRKKQKRVYNGGRIKSRQFVGTLAQIKQLKLNHKQIALAILIARNLRKGSNKARIDIAVDISLFLRTKLGKEIAPCPRTIENIIIKLEEAGLIESKY
jgi:hypothetical protein